MVINTAEKLKAEKGNTEGEDWGFHDLISPNNLLFFPFYNDGIHTGQVTFPPAHNSQAGKSGLWKDWASYPADHPLLHTYRVPRTVV